METSSCKVCDFALNALQNSQFWFGVLAGFVVAIVLFLIWKCISFRSRIHREITIEDSEKGTFTVTSRALVEFIRNKASSFKAVEISDLRLVEKREGLAMVISIKANADIEVAKCLGQLRDQLKDEMKLKLGIVDQIKSIDFEAQELVNGPTEA